MTLTLGGRVADSFVNHRYEWGIVFCLVVSFTAAFSSGLQEFNPDTILASERVKEDYNPYNTLYRMCSWTPVYDHSGQPHKDGHVIQLVVDGGNGIQDPPEADGSPGGDDSLASGNFCIQFVNGKKHDTDGMEAGMFVGMMYYVPYSDHQSVYLRVWEGPDADAAVYYQDTEQYETFVGDKGGPIITLRADYLDDVNWQFGLSKRKAGKK